MCGGAGGRLSLLAPPGPETRVLAATGCESERRTCAEARETACRTARRYVGVELFHRAQGMIDPGEAA